MFDKVGLDKHAFLTFLEAQYGLEGVEARFMPVGADMDTFVYRVRTRDQQTFFVKLRRGAFFEAAVHIPRMLLALGVDEVIPPIRSRNGAAWAVLPPYTITVSIYIEGRNGYEKSLTDAQWSIFGRIIRELHRLDLPKPLQQAVPRETFTDRWRRRVRGFLSMGNLQDDAKSVSKEVMRLLHTHQDEINDLIRRADQYARVLAGEHVEAALCHADLHAGNLHITADGRFYLIDWDTLRYAPRERDLMFIGAGLAGGHRSPEEENRLFYRGYGPVDLDQRLLAYYRYERILEDIALYCDELLHQASEVDYPWQSFAYLKSNFEPSGTIDLALKADPS